MAILHGRERPHQSPRPAAAAQSREHVVARLAALAGDDADRARQRRARKRALVLEQALGRELAAEPLDLCQQVALPGDPQVGDLEGEVRRRGPRAGIEVAAAGDHDLRAVGERSLRQPEALEVRAPHRARQLG